MPFDLVIDEQTVDGDEARVSKTSVCGAGEPVAGKLRYFADRSAFRARRSRGRRFRWDSCVGTRCAVNRDLRTSPRKARIALVRESRLTYFGFELERDEELLDEFPAELRDEARRALAEALARGETRHVAVKRNRQAIEEVRELYRRSGGTTGRLGMAELTALYEEALGDVASMREYRAAPLRLALEAWVTPEERERLMALPSYVEVRDKPVGIDYDVEESRDASGEGRAIGVAKLVLPEKLARTLTEGELPALDRPLRFLVHRGQRGSVHASTLGELQELLDRPWSPEERDRPRREREEERTRRGRERDVARVRSQFAREKRHGQSGNDRRGRDEKRGRNRRRRGN